jgi:signal recognition particle receptor subunit beta
VATTLLAAQLTPVLHLVTCGSVDDGKSTLIGRLLAETGSVPIDTLEYARRTRRGGSTIPVGEIDYSLLTDGLEAEREQGITIDVAYRHMNLPNGRRVLVADSPGHEQYTRNMAVAASNGDVAILMVDAARGVRAQTHRHLTICALMGVRARYVRRDLWRGPYCRSATRCRGGHYDSRECLHGRQHHGWQQQHALVSRANASRSSRELGAGAIGGRVIGH